MHHFFDAIQNTRGDALIGYYVRLTDSVGNGVSLYADVNLTPIIAVSGVADAAKVDSDGNADFYVASGTYTLNIYATDSTTLVKSIVDVPMLDELNTTTAISATDRTALAAITSKTAPVYLQESGREGLFVWSAANNSANVTKDPQQGVYVAPASDTTGASGAWVRHPGIDNWKNVKWFGAKGDGTTDDHIALQAAITYGAATGVALYAPRGAYRNSALLTSTAPIHLFGDFVSQDSTGTATPASILGSAIYSDAGVGGLLLYYVTNLTAAGSPTIYPSATGSIIERIQFHSAGEGAAHAGIYGVESRAACTLRDVIVRGFGDHGVHIRGSTSGSDGVVFGSVNGSILENVKSISNAGAGLRISGNDANSLNIIGGLYQANTGWGIDNDSFQGCNFYGPVVEGNTAGPIITRRPLSAANLYSGVDNESGTCSLGTNDTVIGAGLSETNSGQTNQFHGLLHAYDATQLDGNLTAGTSAANSHTINGLVTALNGVTVRGGNSYGMIDAAGALQANIFNDGTNIDAGATSTVPLKAFSYKIGASTVINSSGVLQAGAFPALTGDVTTIAGALAATIPAGTVTLAKMANMATASLIYRKTAGSGAPEVNTLATLKTDLGLTGTNSGDQTITLTGNVTGSGTGSFATVVASVPAAAMPALTGDVTTSAGAVATTIAANAVTYAKFNQVAASSLVGNPTGSLANAQGITLAGGLAFSGTTLTAAGALTPTSLASTGAVTSSSATAGIGYATGAGGAVTQLTSRTTGVTLNKICGAITLVSAAGSATWNTFTVTNSAIAATDTVEIVQKSGANLYNVIVTAIAAGTFNVSVSAVSGTATESPVFNFVITKAVAA